MGRRRRAWRRRKKGRWNGVKAWERVRALRSRSPHTLLSTPYTLHPTLCTPTPYTREGLGEGKGVAEQERLNTS